MKKIDKRVEKNRQSIFALKKLLESVIHEPASFSHDKNLWQALNSQSNLSHYTDEKCGIFSMSLNTTKRIADSYFDQGFSSLDQLRAVAKEAILKFQHNSQKSSKITKVGLLKGVAEFKQENQLLKEELLLVSGLLQESMQQAYIYAERSGNQNLIQLAKKEQNELRAKLSLKNTTKLVKLAGYTCE